MSFRLDDIKDYELDSIPAINDLYSFSSVNFTPSDATFCLSNSKCDYVCETDGCIYQRCVDNECSSQCSHDYNPDCDADWCSYE